MKKQMLRAVLVAVTFVLSAADVVRAQSADALKVELAVPPVFLSSGPEAGNWEYIYDLVGDSTGSRLDKWWLSGFDMSKIVNHVPGDPLSMQQKWDHNAANSPDSWHRSSYGSYSNDSVNWLLDGHAGEILNTWHFPYEYTGNGGSFTAPQFISAGQITGDGDATPYDMQFQSQVNNGLSLSDLLATLRVVHPYPPGTIQYRAHTFLGDYSGDVVGPAPPSPPSCIVGDADCDLHVDIAGDILPGFSNFTGPGSFGRTRIEGDVHGPSAATAEGDPHDGDVDVQDLLTMFGNFTGPPVDETGGLVAADAGDPNAPDLIYNAATGEVTLDVDGSGIIGYVLKNGDNSFVFGNHLQILAGVKTSVAGELSEAAFATSVGANSIGNVFPLGMNLAALTAYLTVNDVSRSLGAPVVPFDLVVLAPAVPEPSTYTMAAIGLIALGLYGWRRKRA